MSRSRTSRATSASVRPTSRPAAIWATTRSAAWAASVSRAISSASLTIRRRPRIGEASSKRALGQALLEAQQVARREVVGDARSGADPIAAASRTIEATSACGSSVSSQVTTGSRPAAAGGQTGRRRLEARRDQGPSPAVGMTSIVSRSSGIAG